EVPEGFVIFVEREMATTQFAAHNVRVGSRALSFVNHQGALKPGNGLRLALTIHMALAHTRTRARLDHRQVLLLADLECSAGALFDLIVFCEIKEERGPVDLDFAKKPTRP